MFKHPLFLTILCLGALSLGRLSSPSITQDNYSISLSSHVMADPGQTLVPIYFVLTSSSPIGGVDMFLDFDQSILTCASIKLLTYFQYTSYDIAHPGKILIVLRRHHPDSTFLPPLLPGTDTLGIIEMNVTSKDLLVDLETPIRFFENPLTPLPDNMLIESDSSFIIPPELSLSGGSIFIRHPLYGDLNDDGYPKTVADVIFFANFISGSQQFTPRQRANSDVNRDGIQGSMADFVELIRAIVEE